MIPSEQLNKIANKLYNRIASSNVYIDEQLVDSTIKKKTIKDNVIKVFISISNRYGTISKVEVIDEDGDILQVQEMEVYKDNKYKFLAIVEIRVENEVIRDGRY